MRPTPRVLFLGLMALVALVRCTDPVPDRLVAAQGDERAGYPQGEYHRPGQVCSACHRENGEASDSIFSVSGTIFSGPNDLTGVYNAEVQMTDSVGTTYIATTNCVGNFFVKPSDWSPKFPILVRVHKGTTALSMHSQIGRETSCNACHLAHDLSPEELHRAMPHIALFGGPEPDPTIPEGGCPVDAHVGDLGTVGGDK